MRRVLGVAVAAVCLLQGCRKAPEPPAGKEATRAEGAGGEEKGAEEKAPQVPVRVAAVSRADLVETATAPGRTVAFRQQKIRSPFSGILTELKVVEGDRVKGGDVVGTLVSRESAAALQGAQEMLREAKTPAEKADAERAVALAERSLVSSPLRVPVDGVVLAHGASSGDRVSEDQEILSVSAADSLVFQADLAQSDLPRIHPGSPATLAFAGRKDLLSGRVHDILANSNPADLTVPVRIDFNPLPPGLGVGLFGTARIVVAAHPGAWVVPNAAVIRDDITGVTRIAVVNPESKAHWTEVKVGIVDGARTEILSPALKESDRVVVSGQVGLLDDSSVVIEP